VAATEYAKSVVANTHFDYSASNSPYFMNSNVFRPAKLLFKFRKYQQHMIYNLVRSAQQAYKGETAEERAIARRTLAGLFAWHGVAAGVMGMPFMAVPFALANLAYFFGGSDDEPWDAEDEFRNFLADALGQDAGELVAKGALRGAGADVSQRIGLGELGLLWRWTEGPTAGRSAFNEAVVGVLGAPASIGASAFEAAKHFSQGNMARGWEQATPKFLRDVIRSYRFANEGLTSLKGRTRIDPEAISEYDIALQVLGFTPSTIAEAQAAVAAKEGAEKKVDARRQRLINMHVMAVEHGNREDAVMAADRIAAFNKVNPEKRITTSTLFKARREAQRVEDDTNEQGVRTTSKTRRFETYARFANVQ
jgi:hypothetical protein